MIEVKMGCRVVDLPYTLRLYGVSEELFDALVDDDTRAELINGVMVVHSPATVEDDHVSGFPRALISFYADAKGLGKVLGPDSLVHLATGHKFAPDVYFLHQGPVLPSWPKGWEGLPDLVVEVLSPSTREDDLNGKRPVYRQAGMEEMWFVDLERKQMLVERREEGEYREEAIAEGRGHSRVLEGFWMEAARLWSEPLPNQLPCLQAILGEGTPGEGGGQ